MGMSATNGGPTGSDRTDAHSLNALNKMRTDQLQVVARDLGLTGTTGLRKTELIYEILRAQTERRGLVFAEGVLEALDEGYGFLRSAENSYLPGADDIYVSPSQINRFALQTGDTIAGQVRPPKEDEKYFALIKVEAINGADPEKSRERIFFENLVPLYPLEQITLETTPRQPDRAGDGPAHADRQGPARADRRAPRGPARRCCCSRSPTRSRPTTPRSC